MVVERIPGEKVYIDWIGDQPEILMDSITGELKKVHFFVTTVGVSNLVYAEAFEDEKLPNFIAGTVHALESYGALPKYLVPDNLKTAITRHTKDELVINPAATAPETERQAYGRKIRAVSGNTSVGRPERKGLLQYRRHQP